MTYALALTLLAAAPEVHTSFKAGDAPKVDISTVNGKIDVKPSANGEVKVDAVATGRWIVDAHANGDSVTVRACCEKCDEEGHRGRCDGEVKIDVQAPAASQLEITSVNAPIDVRGISGPLQVDTVNGTVTSEGSTGKLKVNGVSAKVLLAPKALERIVVGSVSGDVKIKLPANADADLEIGTVSGRVNGRKGNLSESQRKIGKGGKKIEVSTVSGAVDVGEN
jgi:DUF4097 and DUF4098 domain-containing protein YvlB